MERADHPIKTNRLKSGGALRYCVRNGEPPIGIRWAFPEDVVSDGGRRCSMLQRYV